MQSRRPLQIRVLPEDRIVEASHGENFLEVLLRHKIELDHSCGGFGTCGTCRILIVEGADALLRRNEVEAERAEERGFSNEERLACQTEVQQGVVIRRPTKATLKA